MQAISNKVSERLIQNKEKILKAWEIRANNEISAALQQEKLALRNSIPEYLVTLSKALSTTIDRNQIRQKFDEEESARLGRKHGHERAKSADYTMDQMIFEYHILRQVIFDVMEEEAPLTEVEREIIVCSIEQAVNDAATQFSDTLRTAQEHLTRAIAHDLRNPIAAAKLGSQMISRKPEDTQNNLKTAVRITNSMDRLDSMIQDLLDASLMGAGKVLPLKFEEFDLEIIANQIADEFNFSFEDRIVVKSSGSTNGKWSKSGISRIIENLTTNAIKYGDPKANITYIIQKNNQSASISVHNSGSLISTEEQGVLFQQFRRSKKTEGKKEGWGLGLTIVKGIVEVHHGKISIESSESKGTTFIIELPLQQPV